MGRFSHDDAFPVIARLIHELSGSSGRFVQHAELVDARLHDPAGAAIVRAASDYPENECSPQQWGSNMVQWFSQRITQESSEYSRIFERQAMRDGYAYRPAQAF